MKTKKINNKRIIIIATGLLLIATAGAFFMYQKMTSKVDQSQDATRPTNTVDYGPPTDEEKAQAEKQKEQNIERSQSDSAPPSRTANVVVVDSSQYGSSFEVRGYVSNVFEEGGSCTARFSRIGSNAVVKVVSATKSATTTQCQTIEVPVTEFNVKGDWNFTLEYSSPSKQGITKSSIIAIR